MDMSTVKKRIEEMTAVLADDQLEEVAGFMADLLMKREEKALREGMLRASQSSLVFWDNCEDEVWDHV